MRSVKLRRLGAVAILLTAVLLSGPARSPARAAGPSFSCDKASAPVDRAICGDAELSALDLALEQAFRAARAGDPAGRDDSLRAQRAWLKGRADTCHLPSQGQATKAQTACLTQVTTDRIAILQPRDPRDVILATKIADEIRHKDGFINRPGSLAAELGMDPESPVRFATKGEPFKEALAARLPPLDGLDDMKEHGAVYRFDDPSSMLAVAALEGTAQCWSYKIFRNVGSTFEAIAEPDPSSEGRCGDDVAFGSTRNVVGDSERPLPLFADESYAHGTFMPTLLLLAYRGDRWRRIGRFTLSFETALNVAERSCAAQVPCDDLASDALQLARARDASGMGAPDRLGAALRTTALPKGGSPEELPEFGDHSFGDWSTFESDAPSYKLATSAGIVAMRISHATIGWRTNEDYIVAAYRNDGGTWHPIAGFQIAKSRVRLRAVTVE